MALSDVVRVICPNLICRVILSVPASARGKTVRCRQCGALVRIPEAPAKPAEKPGAETPASSKMV